ncbi:helix-turn-helix domain-containing protein [Methylomagnum ishizawai]|uniref:helix-turn-helix domain-containing protein n=1 Tax=Methylomagnum ishizawai TaxID=1760988 RepID=UPI0020CAFA1D|nr:helix-turn-helix domain-containing protein [Methylomagnum ishizawai]
MTDWHRADIVAALRKTPEKWSLSRLSIHHGYIRTALGNCLRGPWPHGQRLIAEAIGVKPWEIWPSRYDGNGQPISGRKEVGGRRGNSTTPEKPGTPIEQPNNA